MPTLSEMRPETRGIGNLVQNFEGIDWMTDYANNQAFMVYTSLNPEGGEAILGVGLRNENFPSLGRNIIEMTIQYPDGDLLGLKENKFYAFYFKGQTQYILYYEVDPNNPALASLVKIEKGGLVSGPYTLVEEEERELDLPHHGYPSNVDWVSTAMMYLLGHHPDDEAKIVSLEQMKTNLLLPAVYADSNIPDEILLIGAEPEVPMLEDYLNYLSELGPDELTIVRERLNQLIKSVEPSPKIRSNPVEEIYQAINEGLDRESKNPGSVYGFHEWLLNQLRLIRAESASTSEVVLASVIRLQEQGFLQSEYTLIKAPSKKELKEHVRFHPEIQERKEILWLLESLGTIEKTSELLQDRLPKGQENEYLVKMLRKSGVIIEEIVPSDGENPAYRLYRKPTALKGVELNHQKPNGN